MFSKKVLKWSCSVVFFRKTILSFHPVHNETKDTKSFCFYSWKKTPTNDIRIECTYSIVEDEPHENCLTFTSLNSEGSWNCLIQWILELRTWTSFVDVLKKFLDNRRAENYK